MHVCTILFFLMRFFYCFILKRWWMIILHPNHLWRFPFFDMSSARWFHHLVSDWFSYSVSLRSMDSNSYNGVYIDQATALKILSCILYYTVKQGKMPEILMFTVISFQILDKCSRRWQKRKHQIVVLFIRSRARNWMWSAHAFIGETLCTVVLSRAWSVVLKMALKVTCLCLKN